MAGKAHHLAKNLTSLDNREDKAIGSLVGLAVGDALGAAAEFRQRDTFPFLSDMIGGGKYKLKPGEWTDDTSSALCLAESLLANRGLDPHDFIQRLIRWYQNGENTPSGRCFDIGSSTRKAIENYILIKRLLDEDHEQDMSEARNGCIMRLAPVSILYFKEENICQEAARVQSRVTHIALECQESAALLSAILCRAINGASKEEVLNLKDFQTKCPHVGKLMSHNAPWQQKERSQIQSTVSVLHTLEAALWCIWKTNSFAASVLLAANLGDDADTVAAVTGQIAGALYGFSNIPRKWVNKLAQAKRIKCLGKSLFELGKNL